MEPRTPSRRDFLKAGAAAGLTVALGSTADSRPPLAKAKSCIFLMLTGGPSHLDTWDPKPGAPSGIRGPFRPISTRVPGTHVSELFPKMAAVADKFALVRSLHHTAAPIHENGFQLLNTGRLFRDGPEWPSVASVLRLLRPVRNFPFDSVLLSQAPINTGVWVSHGQGEGWLGRLSRPFNMPVYGANKDKGPPDRVADQQRYGFDWFGQACRLTRKLIVWGDTRFVALNMYSTVFDAVSWDCHADGGSLATDLGDYRDTVAPTFDTAFTSLLADLETRGLLDTTLVVAVGEFGRTPKLNANGGRDHWPGCWTAVLAGGGVQGGRVIGASDAIGSEPKDRPVTCPELVATIYHALGIPADTRIPGPDGSPVPVVEAAPVTELF